jgi:hypothetical protein
VTKYSFFKSVAKPTQFREKRIHCNQLYELTRTNGIQNFFQASRAEKCCGGNNCPQGKNKILKHH